MILVIDTHASARRLAGASLWGEQADAITDAVRDAAEHGGQVTPETLRTELAGLEARLTRRFAGATLAILFSTWNSRAIQGPRSSPPNRCSRALDEDLARFPHVNGELLAEPLCSPDSDAAIRQALLDSGQFDSTAISPAIVGALFQSVMEPAHGRGQGAHYTTKNRT